MGIPKLYFYGDIEGLVPALKGLEGDGYFRLCGKDEGGFPVKAESGAENLVSCDGQSACIRFESRTLFFRQLGRLLGRLPEAFEEKTVKYFDELGAMFDLSRNNVISVEGFQGFMRKLALMGYTYIFLYMEDTYEVEELPYFGYMRGRYTQEELSRMDAYAADYGIELIPCIQTLGHLEKYLRWPVAFPIRDTENVLLVGAPETKEFLRSILKAATAPFGSSRIHLGMDEAWGLGSGMYLAKNGYKPSLEILRDHLEMVMDVCREIDLEPMIWSDMFFRPLNESGDYYDQSPIEEKTLEQIRASIPEGLSLVYWDYYHAEKEVYSRLLEKHQQLTDRIVFAGGIWTWNGISPNQGKAFRVTREGLGACRERGIRNVCTTMWGDNGGETSSICALIGMQLFGEYAYNEDPTNEEVFRSFRACCREDGQAFYDLRLLDEIPSVPEENLHSANPSKFLLYQNPLYGLFDRHVEDFLKDALKTAGRDPEDPAQMEAILFGEDEELHGLYDYYMNLAGKLRGYMRKSEGNALMFAHYANLAQFLADKAELGCAIRFAYDAGRDDLTEECMDRCAGLLEQLPALADTWRKLWRSTSKAVGFEVITIRLGALEAQLKYALECLDAFCHEGAKIEELELELLHYGSMRPRQEGAALDINCPFWDRIAAMNPVGGV